MAAEGRLNDRRDEVSFLSKKLLRPLKVPIEGAGWGVGCKGTAGLGPLLWVTT